MTSNLQETDRIVENLAQIEEVAEDILADKQHLIEFDLRRNKTREALRCLQKDKTAKKSWMCVGNMFIKMPRVTAISMLEKDFSQLENEIKDTRNELKPKVDKLRDLQNQDGVKGFGLQPLNREEVKAVERLL
ncbi:p53 and DNA damage-regulated protein 1 [Patella vulgata]|uniref:p53 and DNA damage-regulated protein 1 n=1 Tax=Patella vulgata TaxID=6465 RepID=UPI00217FE7E1|nr:p53 and DNA damage-regulated protein 1 [Patella vulgata]